MQGGRERPAKDQSGEKKQGFRVILLRFWSKGAFFELSRSTFFGIQKKGLFETPRGSQKRGFCLGVVAKLTILTQFFPLRKILIFVFFFDEPWRGKIGLSQHSVCKNHEFSWGRNLAPARVTWVRQEGQQALRSRGVAPIAVSLGGGPPPFNTNFGSQERGLRGFLH